MLFTHTCKKILILIKRTKKNVGGKNKKVPDCKELLLTVKELLIPQCTTNSIFRTHWCFRLGLQLEQFYPLLQQSSSTHQTILKPVAHNQNPHEEKELDFLLLRPIGLFIHLDGFDVVPSYGDISCRNICRLLNIMVQCCVVHKEPKSIHLKNSSVMSLS